MIKLGGTLKMERWKGREGELREKGGRRGFL